MDNRIYRSRETKMLGGVCGGIADMFNMDPTLVRLIAVALTFLSGFTFLLVYVLCAIIIPLEPEAGYILRRHQQPAGNPSPQPSEPVPAAPGSHRREAEQTQQDDVARTPESPERDSASGMQSAADEESAAEAPPMESLEKQTPDEPMAANDETVIRTEADKY